MKKQPSLPGFIHLRVLLSLVLCLAALSLAVTAFGAWPVLPAIARYAAEKQAAYEAKLKAKRGGAKAVASRAPVGPGASEETSPVSNQALGITEHRNELGQTVYSIPASHFDTSPPLTELAKIDVPAPAREGASDPERLPEWRIPRSGEPDPVVQVVPGSDAAGATDVNAPIVPAAAATGFTFDGISGSSLENGYPPDENGSVGNDQFVEMVNSHYQVWSLNRTTKTATSIIPKTKINTLFAGFGGACQTRNDGDPIVLYDKIANRWLLSQFTSRAVDGVFYQCVAISTTPDATGTYHRYAFAVPDGKFGDYPHYGVWTDAYYVMSHDFTRGSTTTYFAASFGAMDRTKMLAGDPTATYQIIRDPLEGGHMPADVDGFAPPPAGAPGIFTSVHADGMYLYRMKVDFSDATKTTRTLQAKMPIAPATAPCGGQGGQCIPQPPPTATTLDSLGDRLMFRLAYRNFIDHESLVVSHSVDPGVEGLVSGVRWYEFRISGQPDAVCGSYPCTYQQGTIADVPNGRSRWMPSIAQDGAGNMIVGYTATGTVEQVDAHSIRYTGRAANHPLGTMTVPETIIQTGNRNVVSDPEAPVRLGRWGDYASTSIDPADDCTFWHVGEFYRQGQGTNTNFDWSTKIASVSFNPTQCQPTTCTSRPATAPTGVSAAVIAPNEIQVTWTPILSGAGSYAIERSVGASGSEGLYQPVGFTSGSSFIDKTVQGGVTYTYRVIAASDDRGRCQALVHSGATSATATGNCTFAPSFAGAVSTTSIDGPTCGITLAWEPATSNCPLSSTVRYNIYRGLTPDFVPAAANRIASCVSAGNSYLDTDNLNSGQTYFYVVRAEDNSTGNGGACGGNEEQNNAVIAGTAYGAGTEATPGTWTDAGGDVTSFLRLNAPGTGNTADAAWRFVRVAEDPGANHTPNGDFAYRNAGPRPEDNHGSNQCAAAETPVLTVGAESLNLTYWERHQMEVGWDGVAIEYSVNGGEWKDMPAPSNATADGCMTTDVTTDYATLACTDDPPINACGYPATKPVITGPRIPPDPAPIDCIGSTTGEITNYGRRCHRLTGLTPGDKIQFRWRFTSDPATEFKGFYLDDIGVTNISLPETCVPGAATSPTPTATPSATPTPTATATPSPKPTITPFPTATPTPTATPSPSASPTATPTPSASPSPSASPTPERAQSLNISTRVVVGTGDELMIGGFIITGDVPKRIAVRAMGPILQRSGIADFLADPVLELRNSSGALVQQNDNWKDDQRSQIEGTAMEPSDDRESVIIVTLNPGAYTALMTGKDERTGTGLVEVYDLDTAAASQLGNISTRGFVRTGDRVMIGGFILGKNSGNARIAVRGRGPSLSQSGLDPVLADPVLEIRNANGTVVVANDDWESDAASAAELTAYGLAPMHPKEAGISTTLPPADFTAILFGKDEGTGIGLVEIYNVQ